MRELNNKPRDYAYMLYQRFPNPLFYRLFRIAFRHFLSGMIYHSNPSLKRSIIKNFELAQSFYSKLENLYQDEPSLKVHPKWEEHEGSLKKNFTPKFLSSFCMIPVISRTMAVGKESLPFLDYANKENPEELNMILRKFEETAIGRPAGRKIDKRFYSHTSIQHIYYLSTVMKQARMLSRKQTIITEFGGGYGNLARIATTVIPEVKYIIIDLPIFLALQYYFLISDNPNLRIGTLDKDSYKTPSNDLIKEYDVLLIPSFIIEKIELETDVLIATYSLTEAEQAVQDYYLENILTKSRFCYIVGGDNWEGKSNRGFFASLSRIFDMKVDRVYWEGTGTHELFGERKESLPRRTDRESE